MTNEEARELFSDAFEGELAPEVERALQAALQNDPALAAEYAEFSATLRALREAREREVGPAPNLLPSVQSQLRARSRGRFYADRFAERGSLRANQPLVLAVVMLVVLALAFFGLHYVQSITAPHP